MSNTPATPAGTARTLPTLAGFEDETPIDLAGLIKRPRLTDTPPTPPTPAPEPPGRPATATPDPEPAPKKAAKAAAKKAATTKQPTGAATGPAPQGRSVIRSSSVHIPVALIPLIGEEKQRTGWSNGQIVIIAIEACHPRLRELIGASDPAGGNLFASRPARGLRSAGGPLTALNVRLYEQDYAVIDQLVEQHGALSRGHLITTALNDYFKQG